MNLTPNDALYYLEGGDPILAVDVPAALYSGSEFAPFNANTPRDLRYAIGELEAQIALFAGRYNRLVKTGERAVPATMTRRYGGRRNALANMLARGYRWLAMRRGRLEHYCRLLQLAEAQYEERNCAEPARS